MNRPVNIAMLALLSVSMAAVVVSYLAGHVVQANLFNADALYLPTLMADLLGGGGALRDWYLTPAPYFFPDMPMFALAYLLGPDAYSQILIFACLQIALLALLLYVLARQLAPRGALAVAGTACIGLMWAALNAGDPFVLLLASAHHYGIFLSSVACASCGCVTWKAAPARCARPGCGRRASSPSCRPCRTTCFWSRPPRRWRARPS